MSAEKRYGAVFNMVMTPEMKEAIFKYAVSNGISVAEVVRRAIEMLLGKG